MGVHQAIYLGPFVEHVIKDQRFTEELAEELGEVFDWDNGVSLPQPIVQGGVAHERYCFMPYVIRPGGPGRPFRLEDVGCSDVLDLRSLDVEAEIDWFVRSYRAELEKLAARFVQEGMIRWGLVKFVW